MTLHSAQWGILAKLAYKLFLRNAIVKVVKATDNKLDDKALAILDYVADYKVSPDKE